MPYWYAIADQPIVSSELRFAEMKLKPGDPGRHLAAGHEEVFTGLGELPQVKPDSQHDDEIDDDNREVDGELSESSREGVAVARTVKKH